MACHEIYITKLFRDMYFMAFYIITGISSYANIPVDSAHHSQLYVSEAFNMILQPIRASIMADTLQKWPNLGDHILKYIGLLEDNINIKAIDIDDCSST